jgi:myo-inositol-1(or 4)-monophosphatase
MTAIDFAVFVDELATVSGETIRPFFRSALSVENKSRSGGFDPVTAADRAAESAMRTLIKRTFPEHGVVGEELDADNPDAEMSGCSTLSTAPNPLSAACRSGAR